MFDNIASKLSWVFFSPSQTLELFIRKRTYTAPKGPSRSLMALAFPKHLPSQGYSHAWSRTKEEAAA
jgi:hypothetical protein